MRKILSFLMLLTGVLYMWGQVSTMPTRNFQLTPQTPTTSQFLRYDEQPVSEYTGVPNISIPIYNIQVDKLNVPIELRYHAGGIKVNQDASWVGLGWDLSLYSVVQIINDLDDLSTTETKMLPDWVPAPSSSIYQYPYYPIKHEDLGVSVYTYRGFPQVDLPQPNSSAVDMKHHYWISPRYYFSVDGVRKSWEKLFSNQYQYQVDSEPDIFKITLPGVSLNVMMDFKSGRYIVLNKKGYNVSISQNACKVVNPDGIEFHFTDRTETRTDASVSTAGTTPLKINETTMRTWLISRIVTPKGKEIKFTYSKTSNVYENTVRTQSKDESLNFRVSQVPSEGFSHSSIDMTTEYALSTNTTTTKEYQLYLNSIVFPEGSVNFSLSERQDLPVVKKLDEIRINALGNKLIKSVKFNYAYFQEKNASSKRLKLLSVIENNDEVYSFTYNNTVLPPKNSYEQDYWGYPNGCTANTSLIPNPARFKAEYSSENNGNNLSANLVYTKTAILEKINYPTGGNASFDYELNEFNNYWVPDRDSLNNKISKGYGLRVKSITYNDGTGDIKKTIYQYAEGAAIIKNSVIEKFSRQFVRRISGGYDQIQQDDILSLNVNGFYSSNPLSSFNSVGYGKVTKYNIDKNAGKNGKIETLYHNNPDIVPKQPSSGINMVTFISVPAFKNGNVPENGMIKSTRYYNDNDILIRETTYEYQNILSGLYYGARVSSYANHVISDYDGTSYPRLTFIPLHTVGLYPVFDFESLLTKKTEKEFTQSDSIVATDTYIYRTNNLLYSIQKINSFGYRDDIYYYYPQDYSSSGNVYKAMLDKNILSPVIKEQHINYQGRIYKELQTDYTNDVNITKGLIFPLTEKSRFSNAEEPRVDVTYNKYDRYGNVLEYTTADGITTAIIWSYMYSYPMVVIKNSTYANAAQALRGEGYFDMIGAQIDPQSASYWTEISNLRKHDLLKDAHITMYSYQPLVGMLTATDPSGITTYYDYDSFGRLKETYIYKDNIVSPANKQTVQKYEYNYKN
jgi:YD repeat-containing protein